MSSQEPTTKTALGGSTRAEIRAIQLRVRSVGHDATIMALDMEFDQAFLISSSYM
jgi:hypothetical protein